MRHLLKLSTESEHVLLIIILLHWNERLFQKRQRFISVYSFLLGLSLFGEAAVDK